MSWPFPRQVISLMGRCDALIAKRAGARQGWRGFGSQETPSGWILLVERVERRDTHAGERLALYFIKLTM